MNVPGSRPDVSPIERGEFECEVVYLKGDVVAWEGVFYRALNDFRSGLLPPPLVIQDVPGVFWEVVAS